VTTSGSAVTTALGAAGVWAVTLAGGAATEGGTAPGLGAAAIAADAGVFKTAGFVAGVWAVTLAGFAVFAPNATGRNDAKRSSTTGKGFVFGTTGGAGGTTAAGGGTTGGTTTGGGAAGPREAAEGAAEIGFGRGGGRAATPAGAHARSAAAKSASSLTVCTLPMMPVSEGNGPGGGVTTGTAGAGATAVPGSRFTTTAAAGVGFGFGFAGGVWAVTLAVAVVVFLFFATSTTAAAAASTRDGGSLRFFGPDGTAARGGAGALSRAATVVFAASPLVLAPPTVPAAAPAAPAALLATTPILPAPFAFPLLIVVSSLPSPPSQLGFGFGSLAVANIRTRHKSNPTTCLHVPLGWVFWETPSVCLCPNCAYPARGTFFAAGQVQDTCDNSAFPGSSSRLDSPASTISSPGPLTRNRTS